LVVKKTICIHPLVYEKLCRTHTLSTYYLYFIHFFLELDRALPPYHIKFLYSHLKLSRALSTYHPYFFYSCL
jgi:hypothetical protein